MTSPLPDDESQPGWQQRILGDKPSAVLANVHPDSTMIVAVSREMSTRLWAYARERDITREEVMRRALRRFMVEEGIATEDEVATGVRSRYRYVRGPKENPRGPRR